MTSCVLSWLKRQVKNGNYSERKEFALKGANSFLSGLTPIGREGKQKMVELLPLKVHHSP